MSNFEEAVEAINKLTENELEQLIEQTFSRLATKEETTESVITGDRFDNGRVCSLCGSVKVVRYGRRNGKQRYRCNDCNHIFVVNTNSIVFGSRKSLDVWKKFFYGLLDGFSLRKLAVVCGIHRNTAFFWRHKICTVLASMVDREQLSGIVEGDETFFPLSFKGNHSQSKTFTMPRKSHKRGSSVNIRGLSKEQVCVPCAVDRGHVVVAHASNLGTINSKELEQFYKDRLAPNTTLVTDKNSSYTRFANKNGIKLVQVKSGKRKKGLYDIQGVNAFHSQLKVFMYGYRGVSTKYLDNYLALCNFVSYGRYLSAEKRDKLLTDVLTDYCTIYYKDILNRPAVPAIA